MTETIDHSLAERAERAYEAGDFALTDRGHAVWVVRDGRAIGRVYWEHADELWVAEDAQDRVLGAYPTRPCAVGLVLLAADNLLWE